MQLTLSRTQTGWIPDHIPPLGKRSREIYNVIWLALLSLAVVGPAAGVWYRFTSPSENSALIVGSRAGLALRANDLTRVRYPIGQAARNAGIEGGDDIVAINGVRVSNVVPLDGLESFPRTKTTDADYAAFHPIIAGTSSEPLHITLRGLDGSLRQLQTRTGEIHLEQEANGVGVPTSVLDVIDVPHVLTYPIFLWLAWALRRRVSKDFVSSLLSLAILALICAEQPSGTFLTYIAHVPESVDRHLYDLGNMCWLGALFLFPDASLRPKPKLIPLLGLAVLPFLHGDSYRAMFLAFFLTGFVWVLLRLRTAPPAVKQQIKYLILSIALYPVLLAAALTADSLKLSVADLSSQLALEALGGICFGIAFLSINFGLYAALVRYRLCDADAVISRSASVATLTIAATAIFAAIESGVQSAFGGSAGVAPAILAAAAVALLLRPIHARVHGWAETKFQRRLVQLRTGLPQCVDDLRETMTVKDIALEAVERTASGVGATHVAMLVGGEIEATHRLTPARVSAWISKSSPLWHSARCDRQDGVFPLRVPLVVRHENAEPVGWLLVGPRYDESFYSKDEQAVLFGIADPVARALQIAQTKERRAAAEQHWRSELERRLIRLESNVAALLPMPGKPGNSRRKMVPS